MTRRLNALFAAMALAMMPLAQTVTAQPEHSHHQQDIKRLDKLDLTEEQKSAVKTTVQAHRKQMIDLRAEIQKTRIDIKAMLDSETPDRKRYEALSRNKADLQLNQRMLLFDMRVEIMNILTPEQRKQFNETRGERMKTWRERLGKHRGKRGGR
jgi:Spy/CpxP family protein refolding chaperone